MVEDVYGVAILQEIGKDVRSERLMANRNADNRVNNDNEPATAKQIGYLRSLRVDFADEITKKEASQLIEEAKSDQEIVGKATEPKE